MIGGFSVENLANGDDVDDIAKRKLFSGSAQNMQISRYDLYKRVSASPLSKLSVELGISGTALAAVCKKHLVPYPGSGYWTRRSLGIDAQLPELPDGPDELIEITAVFPKPRAPRTPSATTSQSKASKLSLRTDRHPLLSDAEVHLRKSRVTKDDEFLRPYKRLLPDLISSEAALPKLLRIANALYLALDRNGYRIHIAPNSDTISRIRVAEQEIQLKDRKYGRYGTSGVWAPDRPTIFYIDSVPIGLTVTEMTERVSMRYFNGEYYREDSKIIRSLKPWQMTHTWTTEQDMPSGRMRIVAYSPRNGVQWSITWQETPEEPLEVAVPSIVKRLQTSRDEILKMMIAEDEAAARRKKEREEEWERYERREDARKVAQALAESRQQLTETIESWGKAMAVERFFCDAEERLLNLDCKRRQHLKERLELARNMLGSVDPLEFIENWRAPEERYRSKYRDE
ncbi:hypothetical protein ACCS55_15840 [Rhizobium ruizarguesonis]